MRIACVDKTASERIALEQFLDDSFKECRKSIGHLLVARLYPVSKEELLINSLPDCVVVGAGFQIDESLMIIREIRSISRTIPVYCFLRDEDYSVRNLKRLDGYVNDVFSLNDRPSRFVFKLISVEAVATNKNKGYLFSVQGVKGGVGATSLAGGLAHAVQDLGKTVVVVDLSKKGEFCQFSLSDKWQSTAYSQLLSDNQLPDIEHIEKSLIYLQNGIPVMPPPAGGDEVREYWLRDPQRLEIGLSVIELLLEKFEVVIVDFAHAEGILPFAIECRSDVRIFISNNEPGSVHLLTHRMEDFSLPIEGVTKFLVNQTMEHGLQHEDVLDFIAWNPGFDENMLYSHTIPYEKSGSLWMGTGNSFFTESSIRSQDVLKLFISDALDLNYQQLNEEKKKPFSSVLKALTSKKTKKFIPFNEREMLPYLQNDLSAEDVAQKLDKTLLDLQKFTTTEAEHQDEEFVYDPPKARVNDN